MPRNLRDLGIYVTHRLMRMRAAPKENVQVSPFELTYGRPFLKSYLLIGKEILQLLSYIINLGQVQKALQKYGNKILPALSKDHQNKQAKPLDMLYLKTWMDNCLDSK